MFGRATTVAVRNNNTDAYVVRIGTVAYGRYGSGR